ncbi:hypothetical protein [Thiolapillus brandeum]|uniref:Uncharacterized protein n=1 Tax=Thiolapillus brandeum TaxID=1076588 RepID=A0A7U6JGE6_9GAMM|nr:hypothetical protein [Thiolapillus brandeum]BAO43431.1 hypothetical protein TBH_C0486 [Thiolapillus brandeum]
MNYKLALLGGLSLMGSALLPEYVMATGVTVNGSDCGNLTSLDTTPSQVTMVTDGACGSGGSVDTPSGVVNRTMPNVTEGASVSLDVSPGLTVKLPYTVTIDQQPGLSGATASVSGSTVTYFAPSVGTVTANGTPDSFTYTVTDSSAAPNSVTATVNVSVDQGEINTNGACVGSANIECRTPDLDISSTGGEIRYVTRDAGITHVWTIPPGKRVSYEANIGVRYVTPSSLPITISLSDNYAADSASSSCTISVDREEGYLIWYSESLSYRCLLDPAKTYYFRVSGAKAGTYWLVW